MFEVKVSRSAVNLAKLGEEISALGFTEYTGASFNGTEVRCHFDVFEMTQPEIDVVEAAVLAHDEKARTADQTADNDRKADLAAARGRLRTVDAGAVVDAVVADVLRVIQSLDI